ncbi:MAG: hypothetical protein ACYDAN_05700 [Candidatus Limnocylindrales bacterium]
MRSSTSAGFANIPTERATTMSMSMLVRSMLANWCRRRSRTGSIASRITLSRPPVETSRRGSAASTGIAAAMRAS